MARFKKLQKKEMTDFPIDAVITWVDGDDPAHRARRMKYASRDQILNDEVGGDIRYKSIGEIKYCVASLLRFAPFLRRIYIVTDAQNPGLEPFLDKYFKDRQTEIEIVDHHVIYRGHEELLPVFNARSIETVLWRIPGLSEHFIYLNDDFLLVAPVSPEDFFEDGRAICYASRFSILSARILHILKPRKKGFKIHGFKDSMVNAAAVAGRKRNFLYIGHIPLALRKSTLEKFYDAHPDIMEKNMSPKFRCQSQYNPQELFYLLAEKSGDCTVRSRKGMDLYLKPRNGKGYITRKLKEFDRSDAPFCCFNSLGYASDEDQKLAMGWIRRKLGLDNTASSE